jgi:hypothetical protein
MLNSTRGAQADSPKHPSSPNSKQENASKHQEPMTYIALNSSSIMFQAIMKARNWEIRQEEVMTISPTNKKDAE